MPPSPLIATYLGHPSSFFITGDDPAKVEARIALALLEQHPRVHTTFEAAADEGLMAASDTGDDDEWIRYLASVYGTTPDERGEASFETRPQSTVYVHKLIFGDILVATTEDFDTEAHLAIRAANPMLDALWLPSAHRNPPDSCLRIITSRSLLGRFKLDESTPLPGRSRPPR
jgi:hypothetical protein